MTLERSGKYVVATFPLGQEPAGQLGREDPDVVLADSDEAITRPSCGRIRLIHRLPGKTRAPVLPNDGSFSSEAGAILVLGRILTLRLNSTTGCT